MKGFPLLRVFLLVLLIIDTVFLMSIGGCAKYSEEVQANLTKQINLIFTVIFSLVRPSRNFV